MELLQAAIRDGAGGDDGESAVEHGSIWLPGPIRSMVTALTNTKPVLIPHGLNAAMRDYQVTGFEWMVSGVCTRTLARTFVHAQTPTLTHARARIGGQQHLTGIAYDEYSKTARRY